MGLSSEELLARILNSTDDYIWAVDADSYSLLSYNEAFQRFFQASYGITLTIGMTQAELLPAEIAARWRDYYQRARDLGSYTTDHVTHGNDRVLLLNLYTLRAGQQITGIVVFAKDISARRRAEEEQQRLLEQLPAGIVVHELDSRISFANAYTCRFFGLTHDQIMGRAASDPAWRFVRADGTPLPLEEFPVQRVITTGQRLEGQLIGVDRPSAGDRGWGLANAYPVLDAGQLRQVVVTFTDITAHKQAEDRLVASERRFSELFEQSPLASEIYDPSGLLLRVNAAWEQLWQLPRTQAVGVFNILSSSQVSASGWLPEIGRVFAGETIALPAIEYDARHDPITRGNSRSRWATTLAYPIIDSARQVEQVVVLHEDVTDRVQLAEQARLLAEMLDEAPAGVLISDAQGKLIYANQYAAALHGYSPAEIQQLTLADLVAAEDQPAIDHHQQQIMAHGAHTFTIWNLRRDGARRHLQVNARKTVWLGQLALLSVQTDLTEREQAEQALLKASAERQELQAQLYQAQKMEAIGRLAGGVAHDFNNLLQVIIGYTDLIMASLPAVDPLHSDLQEVHAASERARALTRQLLAFSRRQAIQPQPLSLNETVRSMEKMLRRLLGEDITLRLTLDPNLPIVRADPGQIEQVVMNLTVNARDAMPTGGELSITTRNTTIDAQTARRFPDSQPGAYVSLLVADTGCGIDEQNLTKIFEPFFTTKPLGQGTGLGLPTVYGIVHQSGGWIRVQSAPGQGTTFEVLLPHDLTAAAPQPPLARPAAPIRATETILLVEDDQEVRRFATRILRSAGYQVLEAADGGGALLLTERHAGPIHLLLADVVLPQMGGHELLDRLRQLRPQLRALYMSGYTDDVLASYGVLVGEVRLINKPFTAHQLTEHVHEAIMQLRIEGLFGD